MTINCFRYLFGCSSDCFFIPAKFVLLLKLGKRICNIHPHSSVSISTEFCCCSTAIYLALTSHSHRQCFVISRKKKQITFLCIINNFDNTNQFVCRTRYLDKCKRKVFYVAWIICLHDRRIGMR